MRLVNRLLAALLSLALIAAGVLVVIEVVAQRLGRSPVTRWPHVYDWARRTPWQQGSVRVACILLAVAGLLLLAAELKRSRPSRLAVRSESTDAAYTRRGVAGTIRSAVSDVDGIKSASVSVGRRKVKVAATTAGLQPFTAESLREPATAAARQRLDALELQSPPTLSVQVSTVSAASNRSR